ncbi:MAG: NAD-dependent epimerase/dehydratase [Bdellovibrionaceae bacterium]|nr:NAD-dependent epimerase/dehydratase [Bdellovibrionales bacterium]MCB9254430.1 NAD-dependent epimerase/dehydratase [Pseudobdellovibrionaceae bacterium]
MGFNILVTGGAGYIGSILVPELLNAGHKVTVVDNFVYGENSLAQCAADPNFDVVNADVRNYEVVDPLTKKADVIIPLAALVGAPLCKKNPVGAQTINHDAPSHQFKTLSKDQWVLMPTSNSAYGSGQGSKFCTEETPLQPISIYARDKVLVEKELMEHENAISFRLATVFGMSPRMRIDLLVNDFVYRACKDSCVTLFEAHFKRNYIHVRDVTRVFLYAIENFDKMKGNIYNVGLGDANLSKLELCQVIQRHLPKFVFLEAPVGEDPDKRDYIVSNEKLEKTGFRNAFSLDMGIAELIKGFQMIKNSRFSNV